MTFFVSSTPGGTGGNLGGLNGADQKCTQLATAAGGGDHTWKAYLSTNTNNGGVLVNAKDRIGAGPWKNKAGATIPTTLHTANLPQALLIDQNGAAVPVNRHDILTGSQVDGTATAAGNNANCENWTSVANNRQGTVGHTDANGGQRWNNAHAVGCSVDQMDNANGEGRIYCFATD